MHAKNISIFAGAHESAHLSQVIFLRFHAVATHPFP